jgi:hypothetical protein
MRPISASASTSPSRIAAWSSTTNAFNANACS